MNFELDEDQLLLRNLAEQFVADRYDLAKRAAYQERECGFSAENWGLLAELGILALPFGEDDGGLGGGVIEIITVMEAMGAALVTEPLLADLLLAGALIARAGSAEQKACWLPRIISGEGRVALAHFEHEARYNLGHVGTRSQPAGDGFRLSGTKTHVLGGVGVDAYLVSANDGREVCFHIVPADAQGVQRLDYRLIDGSVACELQLHSVPASERLDGGMAELADVVDDARIAASAEMLGIMSTVFAATLDHVRTRKQFGVPIGSFQSIQHRLADLYASLEQSRSHLYRAALTTGSGAQRAIAGAKAYIGASAVRLGEECVQFHGGMGTTDELVVGHGLKRMLLLSTLFGDADSELDRFNKLVV